MENGTVIWKACDQCYKAEIKDFNLFVHEGAGTIRVEKADVTNEHNPEPFNDGKYLHYTRFHPQLRDMIGTEGYFYDFVNSGFTLSHFDTLRTVDLSGYPCDGGSRFAYFAVPITPEKTEITLQEIADKFGVSVGSLRIK